MDQLKEYMKVAAKHRFWIAIGFASLLPLIAYFVGTGALADQAKAKETEIDGAHKGAKTYTSGTIQNGQWKDEVVKRTDILAKDVLKSHEKLYARQEPLLDWPAPVAKTIQEWGPKYPEGVDPQMVRDAILEYTQAYDDYVSTVYKTFKPFDYTTGKGIVAAPPMMALLRPVKFHESKLPSLGDVWSAQRKLWIERTMFDVIAKVNERAKAKDWDSAAIKQIVLLEVANALALDQKTDPGQLEEPKAILAPGQTAPEKSEKSAAPSMPRGGGDMGGMGGMAGGGAAESAPEPVQFVHTANADQFFIVPVALNVYIEQDRIPDLLVELRNSPMSIRVLDFEMVTPLIPVKKPKKGSDAAVFGGSMLAGRGMMGRGGGGLMGLDGGLAPLSGGGGAMKSYNPAASGDAYRNAMKNGGGRSAMQGAGKAKAKVRASGEDVKNESIAKLRKNSKKGTAKDKEEEKGDEDAEPSATNAYFNVVEVKIRGQARFYLPPPKSATPEPAPTSNAPPQAAPAKTDAKKAEPAKDDAKADPSKTDAKKADAKDAKKADDTKAGDTKADAKDAKKADDAKADAKDASKVDDTKADAKDAKKADDTKVDAKDAKKADDAKADAKDASKADDTKADPAKADTTKPKT